MTPSCSSASCVFWSPFPLRPCWIRPSCFAESSPSASSVLKLFSPSPLPRFSPPFPSSHHVHPVAPEGLGRSSWLVTSSNALIILAHAVALRARGESRPRIARMGRMGRIGQDARWETSGVWLTGCLLFVINRLINRGLWGWRGERGKGEGRRTMTDTSTKDDYEDESFGQRGHPVLRLPRCVTWWACRAQPDAPSLPCGQAQRIGEPKAIIKN